ncbi:MAG: creatininase family protein [Chloroflexota bacterium]
MNELAEMTWSDAKEAFARASLAVLTTGSIEQHGPHMALETDTAIAWSLARRLTDELGSGAILLPRLDYGLSEHHLHFPGTLTLRPDTYQRMVLDIIESLAHWGMRRVLIMNGHGGNIDALRLVSRTALRDHHALVASVMWARIGGDEIASRVHSESYGHACESETSVAMAVAPHVVRAERISAPGPRRSADPMTDPPSPIVDQTVMLHEWSEDGALGDPRLANEADGRAITDVVAERTLEFARRFMDRPLPQPGGTYS